MTSHSDLFDEAEAALTRAAALTSEMGKVSISDGAQAARQHDRLVAALARHLEYVYGPAVVGMAEKQLPTDRECAVQGLIAALRRNSPSKAPGQVAEGDCQAARTLGKAANAVRLATDVLATHHSPGSGSRTPDAGVIEDDKARWSVTVRAADLAYTAALARSRLTGRLPAGERAREASRVVRGGELANAARGVLTTAAVTGSGAAGIIELRPFAAPLPDSDPLAPAATALQYARAEVHLLSLNRRLGVTALRDLALLGLSIAQHTDAITRAAATQATTHLPAARADATKDLLVAAAGEARILARRWRDVYGQLGSVRSADPPQAGLAHAALAVRAGLEPHTRREGRWATPAEMHSTRRQMNELLTGIRAIALPLDEFAAAGMATLQRRGQLYIDARELPTDPELLHAQHTGRYVPLPAGIGERLADAWQEIPEASRQLTTALAASSGLVGHHPRAEAARSRASQATSAEVSANEAGAGPSPKNRGHSSSRPKESANVSTYSPVTGEATNIESTRQILRAIAATAEKASATINKLSASLTGVAVDAMTLDAVGTVNEAADQLKATANRTLSGLNARHGTIEEAVNSSSRAASTPFYRH